MQFFERLFIYNHKMNDQLIQIFMEYKEQTNEKARSLMCHNLNAHHIWNYRIQEKEPLFDVWEAHKITEWPQINKENNDTSNWILQNYPSDKVITYKNSKGEEYSNTVEDMLYHVINHSNYHRAQIATEFRQTEIEPLVSDFIFFAQ
jgi:uncharacterized damage-inducible protein DinB